MSYKIAIVGATGNVGREMLNILAEREFPVSEVVPLASRRSQGTEVSFGDRTLTCKTLDNYDFSGTDFCLMSAGSAISKEWSPKIGAQGCVVIDNSSCWRYDQEVPLVVPEVNARVLEDYMAKNNRKNIIANPNCSTAQLVVALKPLHDRFRIRRVVVSTYQSVSGAGKAGMEELWDQTKGIFVTDAPEPEKFTKQIAFNVIPHIDVFMEDGYTKEEWKMVAETKKMMDPKIKLTATCVRVPVFVGHSEAVNIEFEEEVTPEDARAILREAPGCLVVDKREDGGYVTPVECVGDFATFISRIREDITVENGLAMWVVSDNLRKGAALNTVQIAETLINRGLMTRAGPPDMAARKIDTGTDELLCSVEESIATITLNRPERRNALSDVLTPAFRQALLDMEADADVRVLIVTGSGKAFCAGGDVGGLGKNFAARMGGESGTVEDSIRSLQHKQNTLSLRLHQFAKPVIAVLPGAAAGAGMSIALACDIRIASEDAFLAPGFVRIGLSGDYGGSWYLTQLIGPGRAKEIYMTGRRVGADEALALGIFNRVVPTDELASAALELAQSLAEGPPTALRYMKENFNRAAAGDLRACLDMEADRMVRCTQTEDHQEGVAAFMEKRAPTFQGR